jgi:putative hydrolase of the HAD superfamily
MGAIKVIFFDAAGTLFHVKGSVADIYLRHAEKYGVQRTPEVLTAVKIAFARAFADAPPPVFAVSDPKEIKQCERLWWFDVVHNVWYRVGMFEQFDEYFEEVFEAFGGPSYWTLYPDTVGALKNLKKRGYELGIVSNFDSRLFDVLRGLAIADLFDTITISSLAHAAKPAPKIFRLALDKHAMDPAEAVHVGDSRRDDVEGARKAGLQAVLIERESQLSSSALNVPTIQSLEQLPALIAAL